MPLRNSSRWAGRWNQRRVLWAVWPLIPILSGCLAAPRPASQIVPVATGAAKDEASLGKVDTAVLPAGYWSSSSQHDPTALLVKGRRVAITGFAVELIDLQFQPPTPRQPAFKPLPIPFGGVGWAIIPGLAFEVIGLGRRTTPMSEDEQLALTNELYDAFEVDLRSRGFDVVPRDVVIASPANAGRLNRPVSKSTLLMLLNPIGSDTGQVLHTRTLGEPGLRRGGSRWSRRPEADLQILKEVGADIALDVRLRVGTYRKKAALEHRSIIRITTPEDQTILRARHSVLSDADVSKDSHFVPVAGRVVSVNPDEFTRELKAILPKFISLALVPSNK